jgi:uncharacterized protein (DUF697 family)
MDPALRRLTAKYAVVTAIAAFVAQPIPVADEMVVLPLQYWFAGVFVRRRGNRLGQAPWWGVTAILGGGVGARIASRLMLGLLPPAGAIANAVASAATTVLVAMYVDDALADRPQRS